MLLPRREERLSDELTPGPAGRTGNTLLDALPEDVLNAVRPSLEAVDLPRRMSLIRVGQPIDHAYFVTSGIASQVAIAPDQRIETAIVGHEGMTGLPIVLGTGTSPHEVFVQVEGRALRVEADVLRRLVDEHAALREVLGKWTHLVLIETAQTVLANVQHTIEERLARWLLMCQDRLRSPFLMTTHDFLSVMLGVRRAGVTLALHSLEGARMIRSERGQVMVLSREGLIEIAGDCYGVAEAERRRLFGDHA